MNSPAHRRAMEAAFNYFAWCSLIAFTVGDLRGRPEIVCKNCRIKPLLPAAQSVNLRQAKSISAKAL